MTIEIIQDLPEQQWILDSSDKLTIFRGQQAVTATVSRATEVPAEPAMVVEAEPLARDM